MLFVLGTHADCKRTPEKLEQHLFDTIMTSHGITSRGQVMILTDQDKRKLKLSRKEKHCKVAAIGQRLVQSAKAYLLEEIEAAEKEARKQLAPTATPEEVEEFFLKDKKVVKWREAYERLMGESPELCIWRYVFISSPFPNAFVTEVLPHRIFITTAMLDVAETPDELAFVLGHEISHLILGHVSISNQIESFLSSIEIILLALDPTEGLLSIFAVRFFQWLHDVASASISRDHEAEADAMGIMLAARACFDTHKGSHVLYKMNRMENGDDEGEEGTAKSKALQKKDEGKKKVEDSNDKGKVADTDKITLSGAMSVQGGLLDSHPPTIGRWERMKEMSEEVNYKQYGHCKTWSAWYARVTAGKLGGDCQS